MVSLSHGLSLLNTFLLAVGVNLIARDANGLVATVGSAVSWPLILVGLVGGLFWISTTLGGVLENRYGN